MPEDPKPGQFRNHRGDLLDMYGDHKSEVYRGFGHQERYLVWYGWHTSGSFTGHRKTFASLSAAKRCARGYEARGYDTKISDRALPEPSDSGRES